MLKCKICSKELVKGRKVFCSVTCAGVWRRTAYKKEGHPRWQGGERTKACGHCGVTFSQRDNEPRITFAKRKFCCKKCADVGGLRYHGKDHPNYREDALRKSRGHHHHQWVNAVLSRDKATCQHCGATDRELHAHHIKSYKAHPELRYEVGNGITLCYLCHYNLHSAALNENPVNSVEPRPGNAEGNTEPSFGRKPIEGVTTSGRASRRWVGKCDWCGTVIVKRWSDAKAKAHLYCNKRCMGHGNQHFRRDKAVISATSPGPEREDIV